MIASEQARDVTYRARTLLLAGTRRAARPIEIHDNLGLPIRVPRRTPRLGRLALRTRHSLALPINLKVGQGEPVPGLGLPLRIFAHRSTDLDAPVALSRDHKPDIDEPRIQQMLAREEVLRRQGPMNLLPQGQLGKVLLTLVLSLFLMDDGLPGSQFLGYPCYERISEAAIATEPYELRKRESFLEVATIASLPHRKRQSNHALLFFSASLPLNEEKASASAETP